MCFLCRKIVSYKNKNSTKFKKHMTDEHNAYHGMEYLLAGCTMSEEERLAVKDVIKDRIEQDSESDHNTSLDENSEEKSKTEESEKKNLSEEKEEKPVRHQCGYCPISYVKSDNLEEHLAKKHPNKKTKSKVISDALDKKNSNGKIEKVAQNGQVMKKLKSTNVNDKNVEETETKRKNLTATTPVPKDKSSKSQIADADQSPGGGKICPICLKEFPKNGPMRSHFVDIHQPGEFPCPGCNKVFTSKNKMSSHFSRNCNPKKRLTL